MADERYNFTQARARLEEIVAQVRKKDTSLEKSLDLLEEGVRLANTCTELSDHTEWRTVAEEQAVSDNEDVAAEPDSAHVVDVAADSEDETADAEAEALGDSAGAGFPAE